MYICNITCGNCKLHENKSKFVFILLDFNIFIANINKYDCYHMLFIHLLLLFLMLLYIFQFQIYNNQKYSIQVFPSSFGIFVHRSFIILYI